MLVPISQHIRTLNAARLAADVEGVPTVLLCRTDAHSAQLLTTDVDERDRPFITGERTAGRLLPHHAGQGVDYAIARSLAYAPYADLLWWETSEPNLEEARAVRRRDPQAVPRQDAGLQLLAQLQLEEEAAGREDRRRSSATSARMGYKFQFVTLAGFHSLNHSMFQLARGYKRPRHGGVFGAAAGRVRRRGRGLHRHAPPARGRRRLFRRGGDGDLRAASPPPRRWPAAPRRTQFHGESHAVAGPHGPRPHDDGLVHNHEWAVTAK